MTTLDDLMKIEGVAIAFEFTAGGKLADYRTKRMTPEAAAMAAEFCATVTMLFNTLVGTYTKLSEMDWVPQCGWMYAGGDYTVAIGGNREVFIETAKADFNRLYGALAGER